MPCPKKQTESHLPTRKHLTDAEWVNGTYYEMQKMQMYKSSETKQ